MFTADLMRLRVLAAPVIEKVAGKKNIKCKISAEGPLSPKKKGKMVLK